MDALAHDMESIFLKPTAPAPVPAWHKNLVNALLATSGGIGGAAIDARGNKATLEIRQRRYGNWADLVLRREDRGAVERDASPIVIARRLPGATDVNAQVGVGPEGHFVVAWQDSANQAVMARRYAPIGAPIGPAFVVNSSTSLVPRMNPMVAVNSAGAFIVLWEHAWSSIRARLFGPAGVALGEEVEICLSQHLHR